ncbi:MAG TPA: hypothetical protein VFS76_10835 [Pyrinomonadaceae bacterium]|nr:hypothetical protein [Pyrinomonadaceae bacterium]
MKRENWAKYLEVATNVAVLLVAVALLGTLVATKLGSTPKPSFERGLQKGDVMPNLPSISYEATPRTLVMVLSTTCNYCTESLPFYKRVIEEQYKVHKQLSVVAVFPNSKTEVNDYVQRNRLEIKTVAEVLPGDLAVGGTPTLILVDAAGRVKEAWLGKLSPADEAEVIRALEAK